MILGKFITSNHAYTNSKACIAHKKDLCTASYINDEMKELHDEAERNKVVLLNECGLDPGLDHMSAVKIIHDLKDDGNESITGFASYCGCLPSPESANNALGYKFSWSPIGVLRASQNDAAYLSDGQMVNIDGDKLLIDGREELSGRDNPYPSLRLEHLANRDSLKYIDKYDLDKERLKDMYRGTLRYHGFSHIMYGCRVLGLLDKNQEFVANKGDSWYDYLKKLIDHNIKRHYYQGADLQETFSDAQFEEKGEDSLMYMIEDILMKNTPWNAEKIAMFLQCLDVDLNIFNKKEELIANTHRLPINAFCELLEKKLCFDDDERDMVLMINRFSTNKNKIYESSLLIFGDEEYSAVARTVGFPLAVATQFLLNGDVKNEYKNIIGVLDASNPVLANMILDKCENYGIKFKSRVITTNDQYKFKH